MILLLSLLGAGPAAARSWYVQRVPIPAGWTDANLAGVSCSARSTCTAVGGFQDRRHRGRALIARWNGSRWQLERSARRPSWTDMALAGVSCGSGTDCVAVGAAAGIHGCSVPVLERWNGHVWSLQREPRAAPCTVRELGQVLPVSAGLGGVSCSSTTACTAVGEVDIAAASPSSSGMDSPLVERLTGRGWRIKSSPFPYGPLTGVSCPTLMLCAMAGDGEIGRWSPGAGPGAWSVSTVNASFEDVSCASGTACTVIGTDVAPDGGSRSLAERWDGVGWSPQRPPRPRLGADPTLTGISCPSATTCVAVGNVTVLRPFPLSDMPFADRWTGGQWSTDAVRRPRRATAADLYAVSCISPASCIVVGGLDIGSRRLPLAESTSPSRRSAGRL